MPVDAPEHRARGNPRLIQPSPIRPHGACLRCRTIRNAQFAARTFLIGFATADGDDQTVGRLLHILDIQRDEFGPAERTREPRPAATPCPEWPATHSHSFR